MKPFFFFTYKTAVDAATTAAAEVAVAAETVVDHIGVPVCNLSATVLWTSVSAVYIVVVAAVVVVARKIPGLDAAVADSIVALSGILAVARCNHRS